MALNTDIIKKRLAAAPWKQKDNEAQLIIKGAKPAELKALDVEGVLRLFEALAMLPPRVYSGNDKVAMRKLKLHTQFQPIVRTPHFAVDLIKKARPGSRIIQSQLTPGLVTRVYVAEKKRLSWYEKVGIDGATIGRGQVSQKAYDDVKEARYFQSTLKTYLAQVYLAKMLQNAPIHPPMIDVDFRNYKILIPARYSAILRYPLAEDFVVAAYLAVRLIVSARLGGPGRSVVDVTRFAVAIYHGMYTMVTDAQAAVGDKVNWAPVEAELLRQGHKDEVAYIHEVVQ